jgi:hypothetical protein
LIGSESGEDLTTGDHNTALGRLAGQSLTTGSNNLLLGRLAGRSGSPETVTTASNRIVLGDDAIDSFKCNQPLTVSSDARDKTDVESLNMGLNFINQLNPVTYRWDKRSSYSEDLSVTPDGTHKKPQLISGLLAQDVEEIEREFGYKIENKTNLVTQKGEDGQYSLTYEKFIPILINAVKELSTTVEQLKTEITNLKGE